METEASVGLLGNATRIKNLATGDVFEGRPPHHNQWEQRNSLTEDRVNFKIHLLPHSYAAFAMEPPAKRARINHPNRGEEKYQIIAS